MVALVLALAACERGTEVAPPAPTQDAAGSTAQDARRLVAALEPALQQRDADAAATLGDQRGATLLRGVVSNVESLRVDRLRLRYLDQDARVSDDERERYGEGVTAARVALRFGYAGVDRRPAAVESRVLLAPTPDGLRIAGFGGGEGTRTPLWLQAPLEVVREGRAVLAVAGDPGRYPRLLRRAENQVRAVLPGWKGLVVVEVPADQDELDAALGTPDGRYDAIAGVATTVAAESTRGAPVRVMVNPGVLGGLSGRGAQVVLTHETAHVAVGAPYADMPVWLLEGFADYVALADGSVPVDVAARQVLRRVRDEGAPDGLPSAEDLEPTATDLAATYEEAWLACRFLAARHGQEALVRFYEAVDGGTPAGEAFREVLGTTEEEFVTAWREDVLRLAGVAG